MVRFRENVDYHLLRRKRKKGHVWYIGILSDFRDSRGRRTYAAMLSLKTGDRALARKRAQAVLNDGTLVASKDDIRTFLTGFWSPGSPYLKGKKAEGKSMSPVCVRNSRRLIENYFLPYFGAHGIAKLNELTRKNLTEWRDDLYEQRSDKKISPATINKCRQAANVALQWAEDMEMLPVNPLARVKPVAAKPAERTIFERAHLEVLFSAPWDDFRSFCAAALSVSTGMRLGEVRGLLQKSVNLDSGYLDVVSNWQDGGGLKSPKWDSTRYGVPLPPFTIDSLSRLQSMGPYRGSDQFVFWGQSESEPIGRHILRRDLTEAMRRAGIPADGRSFHSFRHTYVSLMRHEVGTERVMKQVGHTSTATTDDYTHETAEDREVMRKAAQGLFSNAVQS